MDDDVTLGFEPAWTASQTRFWLPTSVAAAVRDELHQREQEAERARELARRLKTEGEAQSQSTASGNQPLTLDANASLATKPVPGWHRVLPKLGLLAKELQGTEPLPRSADRDVNQRRKRVIQRLVELGPDRLIARSPKWRADIDELERLMPNFRGPIRLLRNALALSCATGQPACIPPMLLLGPPGVGKTYFSRNVAELLGSAHAAVQFDQPNGGSTLRGLDSHYGNSEPGLLFNLIALGEYANPVVLLDEVDKSASGSDGRNFNPLAQLLGALERETASRIVDASLDVEFDASLATYIATANSQDGLGTPLLSRMEVFAIAPPSRNDSAEVARTIVTRLLRRHQLEDRLEFLPQAIRLLAFLSPRRMERSAEQAIASAIASGLCRVGETELWAEVVGEETSRPH